MTERTWSAGDAIVHAARPEWGLGDVVSVRGSTHDGKPCQTLTIRFARAGLKVISTAFADLRPASEMPRLAEAPGPEADALAQAAAGASIEDLMLRLPESATDPFTSSAKRLAATFDCYKHGDSNAGLLDWACVQTGMKDPLSRFNRHELEAWYAKFMIELDTHLKKLCRDIKRAEPAVFAEAASKAGPAAQRALRRLGER